MPAYDLANHAACGKQHAAKALAIPSLRSRAKYKEDESQYNLNPHKK
jgi:hypothetical protein